MKFKVDENLPSEFGPLLREAGFEADTVSEEGLAGADDSTVSKHCLSEHRTLVTLDLALPIFGLTLRVPILAS